MDTPSPQLPGVGGAPIAKRPRLIRASSQASAPDDDAAAATAQDTPAAATAAAAAAAITSDADLPDPASVPWEVALRTIKKSCRAWPATHHPLSRSSVVRARGRSAHSWLVSRMSDAAALRFKDAAGQPSCAIFVRVRYTQVENGGPASAAAAAATAPASAATVVDGRPQELESHWMYLYSMHPLYLEDSRDHSDSIPGNHAVVMQVCVDRSKDSFLSRPHRCCCLSTFDVVR